MRNVARQLRSVGRRRGQGLTEHIMIVTLIAILLTAAIYKVRIGVGDAFDATSDRVNDVTRDILQ